MFENWTGIIDTYYVQIKIVQRPTIAPIFALLKVNNATSTFKDLCYLNGNTNNNSGVRISAEIEKGFCTRLELTYAGV